MLSGEFLQIDIKLKMYSYIQTQLVRLFADIWIQERVFLRPK